MANHWFLKDGHAKFRNEMAGIVDLAAKDLCRPDADKTLGDEHLQCQHLFTKAYSLMQARQGKLSKALLCCSKIPDPVVELRYYKSRVRRNKGDNAPQFIEKETGADFALTLRIDLPGVLQTERSVLGQAKILDQRSVKLNTAQLLSLQKAAGPESGTYLLWGADLRPTVVTAENVSAHARSHGKSYLHPAVSTLGQPLSQFFCEEFLGLWFGRNYDPVKEGDRPPARSIPILYHFLHQGQPPPNVVYFGLGSSKQLDVRPGVYVTDVTELEE